MVLKRKNKKKKIGIIKDRPRNEVANGYFTVEASILLPLVLGIILLIIFLWFYAYDRCLMEQDYAMALIRGMYADNLTPEERVSFTKELAENTYREEYYGWNFDETKVTYEMFRMKIEGGGYLEFPFKGLNFWNEENTWLSTASHEGSVIKKCLGIRTFRKILK